VHTVFSVAFNPTISISSPTFTMPRSMRPVTTVPRPDIENTSSTGIRKRSVQRSLGLRDELSSASASLKIAPSPISDLSPPSPSARCR
jgi:hypothetical protein